MIVLNVPITNKYITHHSLAIPYTNIMFREISVFHQKVIMALVVLDRQMVLTHVDKELIKPILARGIQIKMIVLTKKPKNL